MAITFALNTITVTGYTEAVPCNFTDIYNADVAGGWGVVSKQGNDQFLFDAKLQIGDGSTATYFTDKQKQIYASSTAINANGAIFIKIKTAAVFTLGILVDDTDKITKDGVSIIVDPASAFGHYIITNTESGTCYLYSCVGGTILDSSASGQYFYRGVSTNSNVKIYNFMGLGVSIREACNVYNAYTNNTKYGFQSVFGTLDGLISKKDYRGIGFGGALAGDIKNLTVRQSIYASIRMYAVTVDHSIISSDLDVWDFSYFGSNTKKVYRKYELDLKVIDKDNTPIQTATVKIWDKDSNLIVDTTTDANGKITTQTITRGYYNQANGNTLQEASPHLLKIEKAGYTTYEADFTLEQKTDWLVALQVGGGVASKSINLSKRCKLNY